MKLTQFSARAIIVIPANLQAQANNLAQQQDQAGGDKTFTVPLVRAGTSGPIVAYWCNWALTPTQATWLQSHFTQFQNKDVHLYDAASRTPQQVLSQLSLSTPA